MANARVRKITTLPLYFPLRRKWEWWLALAGGSVVLSILWAWKFEDPEFLRRLGPSVRDGHWHELLALFPGTILLSHIIIQPVTVWLRGIEGIQRARQIRPNEYVGSTIAGALESVLYLTAWLIDSPEFIAFWVTVKVAGGWGVWNVEKPPGRRRFQVFLIGNSLQLVIASLGYATAIAWILQPGTAS